MKIVKAFSIEAFSIDSESQTFKLSLFLLNMAELKVYRGGASLRGWNSFRDRQACQGSTTALVHSGLIREWIADLQMRAQ